MTWILLLKPKRFVNLSSKRLTKYKVVHCNFLCHIKMETTLASCKTFKKLFGQVSCMHFLSKVWTPKRLLWKMPAFDLLKYYLIFYAHLERSQLMLIKAIFSKISWCTKDFFQNKKLNTTEEGSRWCNHVEPINSHFCTHFIEFRFKSTKMPRYYIYLSRYILMINLNDLLHSAKIQFDNWQRHFCIIKLVLRMMVQQSFA